MKLLIFGATGGTGRQLVAQALEQGHAVTAYVRVAAKLNMQHPNLTVVQGNILNAESVLAVVFGKDAVLSALGTRKPGLPDLIQGTRNILAAMHQCEVRRSIWVSSFGVGESARQLHRLPRLIIVHGFLRSYMLEKELQERLVRKSDGDWIIVRPGYLTDGPRTGVYRVIPADAVEQIRRPTISRADVADFMLKNLAANTYVRRAVGLTY
ncbi:MAG: SDR family oxidoreductase [Anaerolineae bacterium]|nr:SDR family oxidoreductase [Anaerolineae bacterium]